MKVSILIPTHNRAETVGSAVESALGQTYQDTEVIVYDDGSDDRDGMTMGRNGKLRRISPPTPTVMAKFKDPRVSYVKCEDNHGAAYSRNRLMELATGEYCAWLDSDDVSNKWRIEMSVAAIEKYDRPYVRTATTTFGVRAGHTWQFPPLIVYRGGVSFATVMFRRANKLCFDECYKCYNEDMDWETRYATKYGRSIRIPLTLYAIGRRSQDRLTDRRKQEKYKEQSKKDKEKYERVLAKCEQDMKARGATKRPLDVPWSFVEPWLATFYNTYRKHQAKG